MISLLEACSICMGKKTNYKVSAVYDFGDLWKITVRPKEDPCDPFSIYPFLVRRVMVHCAATSLLHMRMIIAIVKASRSILLKSIDSVY